MTEIPLRRVLWVLLVYALVAGLLVLPLAGLLQRVMILPAMFGTAVRIGIGLGVPLAIAVAWHYPKIGGVVERTDVEATRVRGDSHQA